MNVDLEFGHKLNLQYCMRLERKCIILIVT